MLVISNLNAIFKRFQFKPIHKYWFLYSNISYTIFCTVQLHIEIPYILTERFCLGTKY